MTAYAILLWIGAAAVVVIGIVAALGPWHLFRAVLLIGIHFLMAALNLDSAFFGGVLVIGIHFLLAVLNVVAGIGLWQMKNWGRILSIVLQGLGIAASVLSGCTMLMVMMNPGNSDFAVPTVCGSLVGIGVSIYMISWFVNNKHQFR